MVAWHSTDLYSVPSNRDANICFSFFSFFSSSFFKHYILYFDIAVTPFPDLFIVFSLLTVDTRYMICITIHLSVFDLFFIALHSSGGLVNAAGRNDNRGM